MLSLRLRSLGIVTSLCPNPDSLPAQPRRIYLAGGGSQNLAIAQLGGEVVFGAERVYCLDVGENTCAVESANKAVWAVGRAHGETFEDLIGRRWREEDFVRKIENCYQGGLYKLHEKGVEGLKAVEEEVLTIPAVDVKRRVRQELGRFDRYPGSGGLGQDNDNT